MTVEESRWRVGIIGISPAGLFLLEQLRLRSDVRLIGVFEQDAARRAFANDLDCTFWERPLAGVTSPDIEALFFMGDISAEVISTALKHGKHVIIHEPWQLSSDVLCELSRQNDTTNRMAMVSSLRRWSGDFVAASTAKKSGCLGVLQTVRLTSCEQSIPTTKQTAGLLREFGYHWLDQLLLLVDSSPRHVFAKCFVEPGQQNDHGVWATIEFADGCLAQIDLQSRSRLSHRTGWILEGSLGSYRSDKLYTTTDAGEIVDEPLPRPNALVDPLISQLLLARLGESTSLPTLSDAARVVKLIEAIEHSAEAGHSLTL